MAPIKDAFKFKNSEKQNSNKVEIDASQTTGSARLEDDFFAQIPKAGEKAAIYA